MTNEMAKVLNLVKLMKSEEKKSYWKDVYYKRGGKMVKRAYGEKVVTELYKKLFYSEQGGIRGVKVFQCYECGEMVDYFSLESGCCDFYVPHGCLCADCYESGMGDDL